VVTVSPRTRNVTDAGCNARYPRTRPPNAYGYACADADQQRSQMPKIAWTPRLRLLQASSVPGPENWTCIKGRPIFTPHACCRLKMPRKWDARRHAESWLFTGDVAQFPKFGGKSGDRDNFRHGLELPCSIAVVSEILKCIEVYLKIRGSRPVESHDPWCVGIWTGSEHFPHTCTAGTASTPGPICV